MKASYNCGYKWVRFLKWLAASFVLKFVIFVHHLLCLLPYICLPMPCSLNHHPVWYCLLSCQAVGHCSLPSLPSVCRISTVLFCLRVSIVHKLWTGIVVFQCWGWFPSWATLSCLSWLSPFTCPLNILELFCCEVFSILARESWECQKRSEKTVAIALKTENNQKMPKKMWKTLRTVAMRGTKRSNHVERFLPTPLAWHMFAGSPRRELRGSSAELSLPEASWQPAQYWQFFAHCIRLLQIG